VQDKRRHPRVPINLPITCETAELGTFACILVDVSMGGAFVSAEKAPAFGAAVTLVGDLPGARGARLPAVVRWSKPGGFGVQFGLLGARETHALNDVVHAGGH
jgi:type IV pilus assembly protein PilZ